MHNKLAIERRQLLQLGGAAAAGLIATSIPMEGRLMGQEASSIPLEGVEPNLIGSYGPWAASIVGDTPARLSFRRDEFTDLEAWRNQALDRVHECLLQTPAPIEGTVQVEHKEQMDGLEIEHLSWQLPYGPRTAAVLLKPRNATGKLPAVLGLHDHGGMKFFGHEKITRTNQPQHPMVIEHQASDYGGRAWANELAKRGYVVLVHDTFTFGSRKVHPGDLPDVVTRKLPPMDGDSVEAVKAYNAFASDHEHLMAKSLFCAGLTWPGVFIAEDQTALSYLCSRDDVDSNRVGCAGLSGGGLRTTYLAGIDPRIKCACCVGMMTTWRDYLLNKAYTHTWMIYIPGLPRDLDYPEVLGLRAPLPTLVLNNLQDPLFTLPEMRRADEMLRAVYGKANAADAYKCSFYPGPHKFDVAMQGEAWDWFDRWLG